MLNGFLAGSLVQPTSFITVRCSCMLSTKAASLLKLGLTLLRSSIS